MLCNHEKFKVIQLENENKLTTFTLFYVPRFDTLTGQILLDNVSEK